MKVIEQSWNWMQVPSMPLENIETAGRTCYKSEDKISEGSAEKFIQNILERGHESVIEHVSASVKFITNRGVTHELVRHRLCSFSQESTRYVNYQNKPMEFIKPIWWDKWSVIEKDLWLTSMENAENSYLALLIAGSIPQQAREVLPNSLKTEIITTANLREWRHIFKLRCSPGAHPQMRALMISCLMGFKKEIPILFDDI
jgi:thymidylate synthase (FAD)